MDLRMLTYDSLIPHVCFQFILSLHGYEYRITLFSFLLLTTLFQFSSDTMLILATWTLTLE